MLGHFTLSQDFRSSVGTLHAVPRPFVLVLGRFTLSQDLVLGHFVLSQDLSLKCWDTSHCPKTLRPSVGTLRTVPGPLVLVLKHLALSQDLVLGHFVLCQDLSLKCWDTSNGPKTSHSSVGTLRTVSRPSVGTHGTVPRLLTQVLGHFALSQDFPLKCWDTSHCPKTTCSSVGTPRTVPGPPHSSVGTLRIVPGPLVLVLGHLALSQDLVLGHFVLCQDLSLKCWDTSHDPKTSHSSVGTFHAVPRLSFKCWDASHCPKTKCWDTSHCLKTLHSSVGTLRTVSSPYTQVFGHFALS